jgi:hypothetical protein
MDGDVLVDVLLNRRGLRVVTRTNGQVEVQTAGTYCLLLAFEFSKCRPQFFIVPHGMSAAPEEAHRSSLDVVPKRITGPSQGI